MGRWGRSSATTARSITWSRSCAPSSPSIAWSASVIASCTAASSTRSPVRVDATVLAALEKYVPLAPLHQPHNLAPIRALLERSPELPQVACFDTAFHRGAPPVAQAFALPKSITDRGVRRYGFHGLSYEYIASVLPEHDAARRRGQDRRAASRQRLEHVRDRGRPQRREHDGLHRRRRAADGHALRQPRSGRDALPDGRAQDGRARDREAHLPAVRPARRVRHLERHAHAARRATSPMRRRRSTSSSTGSAASWARSPRRSAASTRSCSPPASARTAARCASASAATRRGSASSSTRRRTQRSGPRISTAGSRVVRLGDPDQRRADDRAPHAAPARAQR